MGPGCGNHDWWNKCALRILCKNGPVCQSHDWKEYKIACGNLYKEEANMKIVLRAPSPEPVIMEQRYTKVYALPEEREVKEKTCSSTCCDNLVR